MANDITGAVWRIDTLPFAYTGPVKIVNASWLEGGTVGDQLVMQTTASKPIIDSKCYALDYPQVFGFLGWFPTGIKVVTLTSGVLQLSVGAGR